MMYICISNDNTIGYKFQLDMIGWVAIPVSPAEAERFSTYGSAEAKILITKLSNAKVESVAE